MFPVMNERIRKCLSAIKCVPVAELELAAADANWYENYHAESILREEIGNRYRLWAEGYVAFSVL